VADAIWESWWFWWMRGYLREGKLWADRCLAAPHIGREPRARALAARALFAIWSGDYDFAVAAFGEAAQTAHEGGDSRTLAYADVAVGPVRALTASMREGTDTIRRGIATFEEIGDEAGATTGLTAVSWVQGITRQFDETDEVLRRALNRARTIESEVDIGIAEAALAQYRMHRGDTEGVSDLIESSLDHLAAARHIASTILTLEVIAELGMNTGVLRASVSILGATAAIRSSMGTRVPPQAAARLKRLIGTGRQRLGDEFDDAFARGATMGFTEAVDHGRALLAQPRQPAL
jgi:non-specific serine/threonine protein kinase